MRKMNTKTNERREGERTHNQMPEPCSYCHEPKGMEHVKGCPQRAKDEEK